MPCVLSLASPDSLASWSHQVAKCDQHTNLAKITHVDGDGLAQERATNSEFQWSFSKGGLLPFNRRKQEFLTPYGAKDVTLTLAVTREVGLGGQTQKKHPVYLGGKIFSHLLVKNSSGPNYLRFLELKPLAHLAGLGSRRGRLVMQRWHRKVGLWSGIGPNCSW